MSTYMAIDGKAVEFRTQTDAEAEIERLRATVAALTTENAALRGERDELVNRAREVTCVWCGYQFESTLRSQAEHLYEHAKVCEKHPVRKAEQDRDSARAALAEAGRVIDPFAKYAEAVGEGWPDTTGTSLLFTQPDGKLEHKPNVSLGDCRRAAAFLSAHRSGGAVQGEGK